MHGTHGMKRCGRWHRIAALAASSLLAAACNTPVADVAEEKPEDLTGTWHLTADLGGVKHALVTFISDGTFIYTPATTKNVHAHGVWKKLGSLTFIEQNREYVFGADGKLSLFADTTEIIELSEDRQSYVGRAVTDLKPIDGSDSVVEVVEFTVYGTRMVVDTDALPQAGDGYDKSGHG